MLSALGERARIQLQVASEFGYSHYHIIKLLQRNTYENAAELIEDLEKSDLQVGDIEKEIVVLTTAKEEMRVDTSTADAAAAAAVTNDCDKKLNLREETERLFHESICLVCCVSKRTRVCLPCCHLTHCEQCETSVKNCPRVDCKKVVECTIRTFF